MVHYQRYQQWKKGLGNHLQGDAESQGLLMEFADSGYYYKRAKPKYLSFVCAFLLFCSFAFGPYLFSTSSIFPFYSFGLEKDRLVADTDLSSFPCSSIPNGRNSLSRTICCDRSSIRSDVCIMKGDVRTHSSSSSIFLYSSKNGDEEVDELQHEKLKPYTRKWETSVMDSIDELNLVTKQENSNVLHKCDVRHDVPAVFFSTGGYTGNVYHEFNDGIIPLFITSRYLNKKVVFVILEYHDWWISKYGDILSHLSDYEAVDFSGDKRTHCFPEAIVGLKIHDELSVDSSLTKDNTSIGDFRDLLDRAYSPRIKGLLQEEEVEEQEKHKEKLSLSPSPISSKPKLVILSRNGSRAIINENVLVKMGERMGFFVEVLKPNPTTELAKIYRALNSSNVMIGVHGAAMTHFLFLRPSSVFIQIIPLGTEWAAENYYGEPARRLGLKYIGYRILPQESSLFDKYDHNDPVLQDPTSVTDRGWQYTKKIYLDDQNVRLNLDRFEKRLARSYYYSIAVMRRKLGHELH